MGRGRKRRGGHRMARELPGHVLARDPCPGGHVTMTAPGFEVTYCNVCSTWEARLDGEQVASGTQLDYAAGKHLRNQLARDGHEHAAELMTALLRETAKDVLGDSRAMRAAA